MPGYKTVGPLKPSAPVILDAVYYFGASLAWSCGIVGMEPMTRSLTLPSVVGPSVIAPLDPMPPPPPVCSLAGSNSRLATDLTINVRGGVDQKRATVSGPP
jgi:hypothetical protein